MTFTDHFSALAKQYAASRPGYPDALFAWLAEIAPARKAVWDCACGNGQASRGLAKYFDHVIATDASAAQLAEAPTDPKIEYRVALAEQSGLTAHSVDIVTVAQAVHWFKLDAFYDEARRVLKKDGVLALWTYEFFATSDKAVLECLKNFYWHTVGPFWPPERAYVQSGYRTLPFPFENAIEAPAFEFSVSWELSQVLGYLHSWSAVKRFKDANGIDPVDALKKELAPLWGAVETGRIFTFPLHMRVARL